MACYRWPVLATVALLLAGCGASHFKTLERPPLSVLRADMASWPYTDYWSGIVFNGNRIGFSHLALHRQADNRYSITSEAAFAFHFLGVSKQVKLHALDIVDAELHLIRFDYAYSIDRSHMRVSGDIKGHRLVTQVRTAGRSSHQAFRLRHAVYPSSAMVLYPVLHGLKRGAHFSYTVYSGELQRLETVHQQVTGIETSSLYEGAAFRMLTRMHGQQTTTWIGLHGKPVLEIGGHGVLVSYLESERAARRYLSLASLNKKDDLIDFSLIPTQPPISAPRRTHHLRVRITGMPPTFALRTDARQHCRTQHEDRICEVRSEHAASAVRQRPPTPHDLAASASVQKDAPRIVRLAADITRGIARPAARARAILRWIDAHITDRAVDAFSAVDVLNSRQSECQGQAYLYLALARASGIPSRMVNGLIYSSQYQGFAYHSWAESWIRDHWVSIDPTLGQIPADATHIKLLEGEGLADLVPLADLVGKLRIRVETVD